MLFQSVGPRKIWPWCQLRRKKQNQFVSPKPFRLISTYLNTDACNFIYLYLSLPIQFQPLNTCIFIRINQRKRFNFSSSKPRSSSKYLTFINSFDKRWGFWKSNQVFFAKKMVFYSKNLMFFLYLNIFIKEL